jgi:hypothetical protein
LMLQTPPPPQWAEWGLFIDLEIREIVIKTVDFAQTLFSGLRNR